MQTERSAVPQETSLLRTPVARDDSADAAARRLSVRPESRAGILSTAMIRIFFVLVTALSSGCVSVRLHEKTFVRTDSREQSVNGADIQVELEGLGGGNGSFSMSAMVYSAAMTSTKGPYKVSLFAVGEEGRHSTMTVHSLRMKTPESGQLALSGESLGFPIPFSQTRRKGVVQAVYHVPDEVPATFGRDSELQIDALISVRTADHREVKKSIRMVLKPEARSRSEFIALPKELYHTIKNRKIPFHDSDTGVNRSGWKR